MGVSKPWTRHALPALPAMGERSRNFDPPNGESLGGSRFAGSSWSPDGRQLAGHRIGAGADGSFQGIVTYSFEFQQFQQLTEFGYVPRYLGDSRRLLFNHQGKLYLVDSRTKKVHLYGSVDGQKFESADPTIMARYSRKYFGRGKDVVAYTLLANHVALQTELIGAHGHESYYVFDICYHNTSEIAPTTITGDMHSVNKANFAILHWFGLNLAPRFTNLQAQLKHLYCGRDVAEYCGCLIRPAGRIDHQLIASERPTSIGWSPRWGSKR
jgi:hypothetical protein